MRSSDMACSFSVVGDAGVAGSRRPASTLGAVRWVTVR